MPPRVYCGTKTPIPSTYQRIGTPYECLRKGVGVGKYLVPSTNNPSTNNPSTNNSSTIPNIAIRVTTPWWVYLLFTLLIIAIIGLLIWIALR